MIRRLPALRDRNWPRTDELIDRFPGDAQNNGGLVDTVGEPLWFSRGTLVVSLGRVAKSEAMPCSRGPDNSELPS
jgi:hypothetical protein